MKEKYNILFVCGYGVGSSAMSEIIVSKSLKDLNLNVEVKHTSVGEMLSLIDWPDIIAISKKLKEGIDISAYSDKYWVEIINVLDGKGIANKIKEIIDESNLVK